MRFLDICRLDLIGCFTLGTNAPRNSMGQKAVVMVAEHRGLPAAPHPSALTNRAPHEGSSQLLSNGRYGAGVPPRALGTLLLGQQTEWALLARPGQGRLMEQVQAGWDNHLA